MLAELGHFSLALSLCFAGLMVIFPFLPAYASRLRLLGGGMFLFLLFSFLTLVASFVLDDFSLFYVAANSSSSLPWFYKLTASWGAHEGSMLLWCVLLAGWLLALIIKSQSSKQEMRAISLVSVVLFLFLLFVFFTSNPFLRHFPPAIQGADLNPLLQDFAFIIHPPLLYMGYVGLTISCALALGGIDQPVRQAARTIRPWANHAWAFLGLGIAVGSWWAYYELGWGGWWFWDPVENSSLMPWLTGAALVHSLRVAEVRGQFYRWVAFLALMSFSLSLLGAFLVRSGILSSVHSFAEDKQRGIFLLMIWVLLSIAGWWLLMRMRRGSSGERIPFFSRVGMLLVNNILLVFAMFCILVGTLYPLFVELSGSQPIAVGPPYFISLVVPIAIVAGLAASVVIFFDWHKKAEGKVRRRLLLFLCPLAIAIVFPFLYGGGWHWGAWLTVFVGGSLICSALLIMKDFHSWRAPHRIGFFIGHLGFALLILGAGLNSIYHSQRQQVLAIGEETQLGNHRFVVQDFFYGEEANYKSLTAHLEVFSPSDIKKTDLYPSRRLYIERNQLTTESAIAAGFAYDLLVTLGAEESEDSYVFTVHHHPFVRWVWLGMVFIAIGSLLAVRLNRRREVLL